MSKPTRKQLNKKYHVTSCRRKTCKMNTKQHAGAKSSALIKAIKANNIQKVQELLINPLYVSATINSQDPNNYWRTPLILATINNSIQIVNLLLAQESINVNQGDNVANRPIHIASYKNNITILEKLLQRPEIDINAVNDGGFSALYFACIMKSIDAAKILLADPRIDATRERELASQNRFSQKIKELFFPLEISNIRTLPKNSSNVITFEPIQEGNEMVNFRANERKMESNYGRFYLKHSYNQLHEPKKNPMTQQPITDLSYYKAHFE